MTGINNIAMEDYEIIVGYKQPITAIAAAFGKSKLVIFHITARHIRDALRLFLITMIVVLACINSSWAGPVNELKRPISTVAVIHCDYSPVSFWNKTTRTPSGFFVDIMDSVAARAGVRVSYICRDSPDEIIDAIENGDADFGVLLKTREREKKLLFSTPIYTTYLSFFARAQSDENPARGPSGHIVGVIDGTESYGKLKDREGVRLQIYGNYREGLFGLLAGEISLFAGEESIVLKQTRETGLEERIKKVGKPFFELQRCLAVRKDHVQLLELMNKTLKDFVSGPEYQQIYLKWYGAPTPYWTNRKVLTVSGAFLIIAIGGIAFWRYVSISKINTELLRTMSERNRTEAALRESEKRYHTLFEQSPDGVVLIDTAGKMIEFNETAHRQLGYSREEFAKLSLSDIDPFESPEEIRARIGKILDAGKDEFEVKHRTKQGDIRYVQVIAQVIILSGSPVFYEIWQDITDHRQAEEALLASEKKYRLLFDFAPVGIVVADLAGNILAANSALEKTLGYTLDEMQHIKLGEVCVNPDEKTQIIDEVTRKGLVEDREVRLIRKDGTIYDALLDINLTEMNGQKVLLTMSRDITEHKLAEKQIQQSLREKETLLREIHHRVKNNLAVISSLLSLQAEGISDEGLRRALEESQQRMKSMALVHEHLYQKNDFSRINYKDFIVDVIKELESIYHKRNGTIEIKLNIEDLTLDIDSAIPCSLIINELVTNAYKYAFPDNRSGELGISFAKEDDAYILTIKDNGIGLPKGVDYRNSNTLGLQIVNVLCKQLRGNLEMRVDRGTEAVITFKPAGDQYGKEKNTDS